MAIGIEHTLESIDDLERAVIDIIEIAKAKGNPVTIVSSVFKLIQDVSDLGAEAQDCFPELKDVDQEEAAKLAARSYALIRAVILKAGA